MAQDTMKFFRDVAKASIIAVLQNVFFLKARDMTSIAAKGPFLVIAPHPDDEVLGCGAFVGRACDLGQDVHIVIVMDGEAETDSAGRSVIDVREKEAERAAAVLGIGKQNIVFLHQPNGDAASHIDDIERGLRAQIDAFQPSLIISPYGVDKHPDHRAIATAVDRLCAKGAIRCPVYEYPIWFWLRGGLDHMLRPERLAQLRRISTHDYIQMKKSAMQAHHTQCPKILGGASDDLFQPHSFMMQFFARYELFFERSRR